jgi:triphosphoribosyl-dephospho-CoA synthase
MPIASLERVPPIEFPTIPERREDPAEAIGVLVCQALLNEVNLTPKPGLVDHLNSGAHRDMDHATFLASIRAIAPWFPLFYRIGAATRHLPPQALLAHIRPQGLACEVAMLRATGNVNTHKGSIFSLGLLAAAAGRLACFPTTLGDPYQNLSAPSFAFSLAKGGMPHSSLSLIPRDQLCAEVARICSGLVEAELKRPHTPRTAGERLFQTYGLTGVRGEAASGFQTIRTHGLPAYERILDHGGSEEDALHEALLHLMAVNRDTNLVHRGGLEGLAHVQTEAQRLIASGGVRSPNFRASMIDFDADLIARNLSPGGSADLLAVTCFLSWFPAPYSAA